MWDYLSMRGHQTEGCSWFFFSHHAWCFFFCFFCLFCFVCLFFWLRYAWGPAPYGQNCFKFVPFFMLNLVSILCPHQPVSLKRCEWACLSWMNAPAIPPGPLLKYCKEEISFWIKSRCKFLMSAIISEESSFWMCLVITLRSFTTDIISVRSTLYVHQQAKSTPQSCRYMGTFPTACARS